jgi:hypothetical protein
MRRLGLIIASATLTLTFAAVAFAQSSEEKDLQYIKRTTLAVRYSENKKTSVDLKGTSLAPRVLWTVRKCSDHSTRHTLYGRLHPKARPRT